MPAATKIEERSEAKMDSMSEQGNFGESISIPHQEEEISILISKSKSKLNV